MKKLDIIFKNSGLFKNNEQEKLDYSYQSKGNSRPNFLRFMHGQAYWETTKRSSNEEDNRKKIIINHSHCLFKNNYLASQFWSLLLKEGFTLCVRTKEGILLEAKTQLELETIFNNAELISNEALYNELNAQGKTKKDYFIVGDGEYYSLVDKLSEYISNKPYKKPKRILHLCVYGVNGLNHMSDQNLEYLYQLIINHQVDTIQLESGGVTVWWRNEFNDVQIKALLSSLRRNLDQLEALFKTKPFVENVERLNIENSNSRSTIYDQEMFDFSRYKNLKHLSLSYLGYTKDILGLDKTKLKTLRVSTCPNLRRHLTLPNLPYLKELTISGMSNLDINHFVGNADFRKIAISFSNNIKLDLNQFPNLNDLTLDVINAPHVTGLENCINLQKCKIESTKLEPINIEKLINLKRYDNVGCDSVFNNIPKAVKSIKFRGDNTILHIWNEMSLEHLKIWSEKLTISGVNNVPNLRELKLKNLDGHLDVSSTTKLKALQLENVKHVSGIEQCKALERLVLHKCQTVDPFDPAKLKKLRMLILDQPLSNVELLENQFDVLQIGGNLNGINSKINSHFNKTTVNCDLDMSNIWHASTPIPLPIFNVKPSIIRHDVRPNSYNTRANDQSVLSLDKLIKTATPEHVVYKEFFNLNKADAMIHPSKYREEIYDEIILDGDHHIQFSGCKKSQRRLIPITLPDITYSLEHAYAASLHQTLKPGELYVLSGLSAHDELLDIEDKEKLDIFYDPDYQQYLVKLKPNIPFNLPQVKYTIRKGDEHYFIENFTCKLASIKAPSLPKELVNAIENSPLVYWLITLRNYSKEQQIENITKYCRAFTASDEVHESVSADDSACTPDELVKMIISQQGSCRHCSAAFVTLAQYLGIPARLVKNGYHRFAEIPIIENETIVWKAIDSGGQVRALVDEKGKEVVSTFNGEPTYSHTSTSVFKDTLKIEDPDAMNDYIEEFEEQCHTKKVKQIHTDWHHYFLTDQTWVEKCRTIDEFVNGCLQKVDPILITMQDKEHAWYWHERIAQALQKQNIPYVYVDNAEELKNTLYELLKITPTGETITDGPVKEIVLSGRGYIMVNWSNFSDTERASFKCMMDEDEPTLKSNPLSPDHHIIGFVDKDTTLNDVFLTRCEKIPEPSHLDIVEDTYFLTYEQPEGIQSLNLYHSLEWYRSLVEDLESTDVGFGVKKGFLPQAMEKGEEITLKNLPWQDPNFQRAWHMLNTEHEIFWNGEAIHAKPGFKVNVQEEQKDLEFPANIIFDEQCMHNSSVHHIHQGNVYLLFDDSKINEETHKMMHRPGLLATAESDEQFIFTETLTQDQWQRIIDTVETLPACQHKTFHFYSDPRFNKDLQVDGEDMDVDIPKRSYNDIFVSNDNLVIETNDPSCVLTYLITYNNYNKDNIYYATEDDIWPLLIEQAELKRINGKPAAYRTELSCLTKLINGEKVIVSGKMSKEAYQSLQSLFFDPPYLRVNGEKILIKGRLLWVGKLDTDVALENHYRCEQQVDIRDYESLLFIQKNIRPDETILEKMDLLYQGLKVLPKSDPRYPSLDLFNYNKYQSIYDAVTNDTQHDNPLKPIITYHYRKGSETYAYLNVLSKILFGRRDKEYVKDEKLHALLAQIKTRDDLANHFWRIANCFSSEILQPFQNDIFDKYKKSQDLYQPSKALRQFLIDELRVLDHNFAELPWIKNNNKTESIILPFFQSENPDRYQKQWNELVTTLKDDRHKLIYLCGDTGTGKTFTAKKAFVKALGIKKYYKSEKEIVDFLLASPDKPNILFLDEATLKKSGAWEWLRSLLQESTWKSIVDSDPQKIITTVRYKGCDYPINAAKLKSMKVVMTSNPIHYLNRNYHDVFWEMAYIVWFAPFQAQFIHQYILHFLRKINQKPYSPSEQASLEDICYKITIIYNYLRQLPNYPDVSLRDINNICARFTVIREATDQPLYDCIAPAIYDEMAANFPEGKQEEFKALLMDTFKLNAWPKERPPKQLPPTKDFVVPPSKHQLCRLIEDDLLLRQKRIALNNNFIGKLGILVEGPSGVGKSKFYIEEAKLTHLERAFIKKRRLEETIQVLEESGFQNGESATCDSRMKYYLLTVGNGGEQEILLKAFREGSVVILDELNLDDETEELLNHLLSGVDMQEKPSKFAGFTVLASQNPSSYNGCKLSSKAGSNRLHKIIWSDYVKKELHYICDAKGHSDSKGFVADYFDVRKTHSEVNARTFFRGLARWEEEKNHLDKKAAILTPK